MKSYEIREDWGGAKITVEANHPSDMSSRAGLITVTTFDRKLNELTIVILSPEEVDGLIGVLRSAQADIQDAAARSVVAS